GDARRLLVEQAFDHAGPREHEQLLKVELSVLAQDLSKDLVADSLRGLDEASAFATWTRLAEHMFQALPVALTGHLDGPERRHVHDLALRVAAREPVRERLEHLAAVLLLGHVDEVDDDDTAQVSQAKLTRNSGRSLKICPEDRLFEIAMADVGAGVHVDR